MATRLSRALALIAFTITFTLASVAALSGQETDTESGTTTGTETASQTDYWYETVEGAVVFTQSLKWDPVPYCPYYDVTIEKSGKNGTWASVHETRVETAELKVRLQPGEYRYRLVVYDVLGRVSLTSEWFPFTVIRALQPKVSSVSPGTIFFEEENSDVFSIDGANLLEASEYAFKPVDGRVKKPIGFRSSMRTRMERTRACRSQSTRSTSERTS